MTLIKSASLVLLAMTLTGLSVNSVLADLPSKPLSVKVMDTNKNGKIEKREYLAFMGAEFDKAAGAKGYCTFAEIRSGLKKMHSVFPDTHGVMD